MKGRILLLATILFIPTNLSFATLGPVHVELNMTRPRLSASRANSVTAFKVYFRYNIDIKVHDWYKIWFPIDEYANSDNPSDIIKQICDGLPKIDEKISNPRFVPSQEYFKKFDNPKLKTVGQIYAIKDEMGNCDFSSYPDVSKTSNWGSVCGKDQGRYRIIKDPSGLGCWMLGTVFPSLPVDKNDRMEKIKTIIRSTSLGYSPDEEQGYPVIINNCKERSYQQFVPLEVEAWRKGYNAIDWNTSKKTGIFAPATPGRYRLAVATKPEPEPVESEAFVLPCSDISDVKCQVANNLLSVNFKTGEGGALDGGSSVLTLKLPPEVILPKKFPEKSVKINSVFVNSLKIQEPPNQNQLMLVLPSDIPNFGTGRIEFLENSGVTIKKTRDKLKISISSSSEPNFIDSEEFKAYQPFTQVTPNVELAQSAIKIRTIIPEGTHFQKGAEITLTFPEGFKLPVQTKNKIVVVNDANLDTSCKIEGQKLIFNSPVAIDFELEIKTVSPNSFTNPNAGEYKIGVTIDGISLDASTFLITSSAPLVSNLELSEYQGSVVSIYEFDYQPSIKNLPDVGDIFTIVFPESTILPENPDPSKVTIDGKPVISIGVKGQTLKIGSPIKFVFGKWIHFRIDCGIVNPRKHGGYNLSIGVGEAEPVISEEYNIEPSPLKSWIYFKDPDKPNCGEWFNKPPILGFECLNPEAKITFWFNGESNKSLNYGGEARMMPGTVRTTITWQAEFGGIMEVPQTVDFKLDNQAPVLEIFDPPSEVKVVNTVIYKIKGERSFTEMITDGDNTKYQVVDSVFIKYNGEETKLLDGEIYETKDFDSIKSKFEKTINLFNEENFVEIIARDQACNETIIKRKIIRDTKAPDIEVISPLEPYNYYVGDELLVKIKTESTAVVYINKQLANIESQEGNKSIFSYPYKMIKGRNIINISATDTNGNTQFTAIHFFSKQTVIVLTMDKTSWTANGIEQTPLKVAPTNKFTDPKLKVLNGTTFMPVSQIAPYFDCQLSWDAKEKKTTIRQQDSGKIIELWIGKTTAKIDGKEVKIDPKGIIFPFTMKGSTMLPFRWFAENLGASVVYDAKSKTITMRYPK